MLYIYRCTIMHTEFVYTHQVPTLKWAGDQLRWVTEKKKKTI